MKDTIVEFCLVELLFTVELSVLFKIQTSVTLTPNKKLVLAGKIPDGKNVMLDLFCVAGSTWLTLASWYPQIKDLEIKVELVRWTKLETVKVMF